MLLALRILECLFDIGFQLIEIERVKLAESLHPSPGGLHGVGVEFAPFHAAAAFLLDQPGVGEHS